MLQGACLNAAAAAAPPAVQLASVAGRELLFYPAPQRPLVALLRGTTADAAGNISFEREPLPMNQLDQARALGLRQGAVWRRLLEAPQLYKLSHAVYGQGNINMPHMILGSH